MSDERIWILDEQVKRLVAERDEARVRIAALETALREIENCDNKSAEIVKRSEGVADKWIEKIAELDKAGTLRAYALEVSCALAWCIDRAALGKEKP